MDADGIVGASSNDQVVVVAQPAEEAPGDGWGGHKHAGAEWGIRTPRALGWSSECWEKTAGTQASLECGCESI